MRSLLAVIGLSTISMLLIASIVINLSLMNASAQSPLQSFNVRNRTTGESLTHFLIIPQTYNKLQGSTTKNTIVYSDRYGRPDDNGDWNVFLRTTLDNGKNSTRGIELGSDSIIVEQTGLPNSKEIAIPSASSNPSASMPQKVRDKPSIPGSETLELQKQVSDFLDNNIDLLNMNTNDHLVHYVVVHSSVDKYAANVLGIQDQFVTTIALDDRYGKSNDDGNLSTFIQISHTKDKVNSLRAMQLGDDEVKVLINGQDQGTIPKSSEISVVSKAYKNSSSTISSAKNFTLQYQEKPPEFTPEQLKQLSEGIESADIRAPTEITNNTFQGPPPDSQSSASNATAAPPNVTHASTLKDGYGQSKIIPVQFEPDNDKLNMYVTGDTGIQANSTGEPSAANNGAIVFYTANWFAARSDDNGRTGSWKYVNPYDMPNFCCDQDVLFDKSHGIFIWYRQAVRDGSGENYIRLSASRDAINWWYWDFKPKDLDNTWSNQWFDYPHIALSSNDVWITTNVLGKAIPRDGFAFPRTIALQMPLEKISAGVGFQYQWLSADPSTLTPVQGASDVMYLGTHNGNDKIRIYSVPEKGSAYSWVDKQISAYNSGGTFTCPGLDGRDWCGRAQTNTGDLITNGWAASGYVGFFWNVGNGGGFAQPHVDAAVFDINDNFNYVARPLIWNNDHAWMYAYASPAGGSLALSAYYGGGNKYNPGENVAISYVKQADNLPLSGGWKFAGTVDSTAGPKDSRWGDYFRVRPYVGADPPLWIGTGEWVNKDDPVPGKDAVHTLYTVFGREADAPKQFSPISDRPSPVIVQPKADANIGLGTTVTLRGYAKNTDPGDLVGMINCDRMIWSAIDKASGKPEFDSLQSTPESNNQISGMCDAQVAFSTPGTKVITLAASSNRFGDTGSSSIQVNVVNTPSFDFDIDTGALKDYRVLWGGQTTIPVNVNLVSGSSQIVGLAVSGLPNGVTASWQCATGPAGSSCQYPTYTNNLVLTADYGTSVGTYAVTITGTSIYGPLHGLTKIEHSTTINIHVEQNIR